VDQKNNEVLENMKCVYVLRSLKHPDQSYIGITTDLEKRLKYHNSGKSPHTDRYKPWKVVIAVYFEDSDKARAFEQYLKSGSGRAFALKHF